MERKAIAQPEGDLGRPPFLEGMSIPKNTRVEYLYRDANNNKVWGDEVLQGAITTKQRNVINGCLFEKEFFVPHQVGLPDLQCKFGDELVDDVDHTLHGELELTLTDREATVNLTINELVNRFTAVKSWDHDLDTVGT